MRQERYVVLDGLRGIAAIMVMLHHNQLAFGFWEWQARGHTYHVFYYGGPLAVDFFFMLSGFVLSSAYGSMFEAGMSFKDYFVKRLTRLYPMYAIGMLVGLVALVSAIRNAGFDVDAGNLAISSALSFAMIPDYLGSFGLNPGAGPITGKAFPLDPPGWSLFFELIVSLSLWRMWRCSNRTIAGLVIASFSILTVTGFLIVRNLHLPTAVAYTIGVSREDLLAGLPRSVTGFYLGVLLFRLRSHNVLNQGIADWKVSAGPLFAVLILCLFSPFDLRGLFPFAVIVLIGPLLVIWGSRISVKKGALESVFNLLGWISFPLYCVHFPIGQLVWQFSSKYGWPPLASVATSILLSVTVAIFACKFVEEPIRSRLARSYRAMIAGRKQNFA